jgi:predicted TIM-barrel fold metal-dependent hydrolase
VGQAAKDFPNLNFVIYHSGLQPFFQPEKEMAKFEETGRINWVSDLAEIKEKHGVNNVYAELGSTFGSSCITHPRFAAALLGILIKGLGHDHVIWGTDSVWYGSPQWQLEAFRRIEIPEDMVHKFGYSPLGSGTGEVKSTILGQNAARLYELDPELTKNSYYANDKLAEAKARYLKDGGEPSNMVYGFLSND